VQSLQVASESAASEAACARELLETVPLVMRVIRQHLRGHRAGLTVVQFRTLCYVSTTDGTSLSAAADFIGLSAPAMSRLVEGLVEMGMLRRAASADDRRHVRLSVTPRGDAALREARGLAQAELADVVTRLKPKQRADVVAGMRLLRSVFEPEISNGKH
jgi:DNA-binding MarR family transcriptional regulator